MHRDQPILLVEDDHIDTRILEWTFKKNNIPNRLDIADNGKKALEYLNDPEKEKPCLILLDLNMPVMNGIEFLKNVKKDDLLKRIPVVVLTTSDYERDKRDSYDLGAAGYILKPIDTQKFVEIVKAIYQYWTFNELCLFGKRV